MDKVITEVIRVFNNDLFNKIKSNKDLLVGDQYDLFTGINKENLLIFKKYLVYLDFYRVNYPISMSEEDALNNFKKVVKDDENKDLLLSFFKKHEHLFCDKNEVRRKKLVPIEYNKRIFRGI